MMELVTVTLSVDTVDGSRPIPPPPEPAVTAVVLDEFPVIVQFSITTSPRPMRPACTAELLAIVVLRSVSVAGAVAGENRIAPPPLLVFPVLLLLIVLFVIRWLPCFRSMAPPDPALIELWWMYMLSMTR